ncbi:hypothetical protein DYB30_014322 [Aphanomyces astaci]|uniref:Uncharacterized protein n=1 Tax=Aphanomyces astaci TaxID=112090 RepID=A0A397C9J1_APHAT|nr:hypothetical protein DYB30_014322 [Aphanomyces astaci]RHY77624.1 hypothetical protein DYB34_013229 [Aphanomyces astaci]
MGNEARQKVLNSGLVKDAVRGRTTDLDGQLSLTRVAHKELEALVQEQSGTVEKLRVERAGLLDQTKTLWDEISRIRSSEEVTVSVALFSMERQRQVDAATVSALRGELGLSRARAEDDKALAQSRYDSVLVQARAAFEIEAGNSARVGKKRCELANGILNEVLDASQAIREQARLDGDELRTSLAQKDRAIALLKGPTPRDKRQLLSNVNMNGELQSDLKKMAEPSDLLSREELQSERKILEETAAGLVSGQAALAQEQARLDEVKRGFAAKVADELALFDEERRSWLTQLSNDRSQVDLERREMNIAMQAERSRVLSNGWNCFACRQQPRTIPTSSLP